MQASNHHILAKTTSIKAQPITGESVNYIMMLGLFLISRYKTIHPFTLFRWSKEIR